MMMSPKTYREDNKTKTIEELVVERNRLINYMQRYEKNEIGILERCINPSPETRYTIYKEYLKEIDDLIIKKMNDLNYIEECEHDWKMIQEGYLHKNMAGSDAIYDLYKCSKCGAQESRAQVNKLLCPKCQQRLMYSMPDGNILYCNNCDKCFENNNGAVGKETSGPYVSNDAMY